MRKLFDGEATQMDGKNAQAVRSFFDQQSAYYSNFFRAGTQTGAAELFRIRMTLCVERLAGRSGASSISEHRRSGRRDQPGP
jgi:hypothetical protein